MGHLLAAAAAIQAIQDCSGAGFVYRRSKIFATAPRGVPPGASQDTRLQRAAGAAPLTVALVDRVAVVSARSAARSDLVASKVAGSVEARPVRLSNAGARVRRAGVH